MKIGFIGFGNHADKILSLMKLSKKDRIYKYHPYKSKANTTNQLQDLFDCKVVFITSPNETHYKYINILIKNSECYIFCEKPPVTNRIQINDLKKYSKKMKDRVYFNFNYRLSNLTNIIKNVRGKSFIGKLMIINAKLTHGLAFKSSYQKSWRGRYDERKSVVLDTSLIHLIDIFNFIYRKKKPLKLLSCISNSYSYGRDTRAFSLVEQNGLIINSFSSYAAPYQFEMSATGTNGLIEINRNGLRSYSPRNTYNKQGLYTNPPLIKKDKYDFEKDYKQSLINSLNYFFEKVKASEKINNNYFDASIETMDLLFNGEKFMNKFNESSCY